MFSFIIPTRGRPQSLPRLCDSIHLQTRHPEQLEVVFVMDQDDEPSLRFEYPGLNIRKVIVPPGLSMGALNMAGYRAAAGRYLMLLNDDVVLATPGWDEQVLQVFRGYPDGIVLVHVNETIFREKLCTFPFLTRSFCELAGGICPEGYLRYRIDDHIHNVFDLLTLLGQRRRIFLPDVVFRHLNVTEDAEGNHDYVPNPEIHAVDSRRFHALLEERKRLALAAMEVIHDHPRVQDRVTWEERLAPVSDSITIRDPRHARVYPPDLTPAARPRVTVGIVSADIRSEHARKCIELVKTHTQNYELVILDNNGAPGFNHSREMNRLLRLCRTDFLVLMDDDVFVEEGWLEGMMRAMEPGVGVVTPVHRDRNGNFSYGGVLLQPDDSGHHAHVMSIGDRPQHIQTLCSAILLIDMTRCGHVRMNETYTKYFMDIEYGLRIWEEGLRVVCTPWTQVVHIGGATLTQGSSLSRDLFEEQRRHWERAWSQTHRIHALRRGPWREVPEFAETARLVREIDALFYRRADFSRDVFFSRARATVGDLRSLPALRNYMAAKAAAELGDRFPRADDPEIGHLAVILGAAGRPVLYEADALGTNIVLWNTRLYAVAAEDGPFDVEHIPSRCLEADDPDVLREMAARNPPYAMPKATATPAPAPEPVQPPAVVTNGRHHFGMTLKRLVRTIPYAGVLVPRIRSRFALLFDAQYYRDANPDVASAGLSPLLHFITAGAFEGRQPHPWFDTAFYLRKYPDVAAANVNPLFHFLKYGGAEGRQPHPLFDTAYYLEHYPDVRKSGINPLVHYVVYGAMEGRRPHG